MSEGSFGNNREYVEYVVAAMQYHAAANTVEGTFHVPFRWA